MISLFLDILLNNLLFFIGIFYSIKPLFHVSPIAQVDSWEHLASKFQKHDGISKASFGEGESTKIFESVELFSTYALKNCLEFPLFLGRGDSKIFQIYYPYCSFVQNFRYLPLIWTRRFTQVDWLRGSKFESNLFQIFTHGATYGITPHMTSHKSKIEIIGEGDIILGTL